MSSYTHLSEIPTYASTSVTRLKSLYSEFAPQKQSNPSSYASNVEWWRRTLETITLHGWQPQHNAPSSVQDRFILNAEGVSFSERFRYEGVGRPLSLATVIVRLERAFMHIRQLTRHRTSEGRTSQFKSIYTPTGLSELCDIDL